MIKRLAPTFVVLTALTVLLVLVAGCSSPSSPASSASTERASIATIHSRVVSLETYTATIAGKVDNQQGLLLQIQQELTAIRQELARLKQ